MSDDDAKLKNQYQKFRKEVREEVIKEFKEMVEYDYTIHDTIKRVIKGNNDESNFFKEIFSTEEGRIYYEILNSPFGFMPQTKLGEKIKAYAKTLSQENQENILEMMSLCQDRAWRSLYYQVVFEKLPEISFQISPEYIKELNTQIKKLKQINACHIELFAEFLNNDRWATVPQFYDIVDQEKEYIGTKANRGTKINRTKKKLQKTISMFKTKKEGRYYRIEDIVEAALSLGYVKSGYKGSIIEEMKYKDNSRTKTDLESKGFEITGDNE